MAKQSLLLCEYYLVLHRDLEHSVHWSEFGWSLVMCNYWIDTIEVLWPGVNRAFSGISGQPRQNRAYCWKVSNICNERSYLEDKLSEILSESEIF